MVKEKVKKKVKENDASFNSSIIFSDVHPIREPLSSLHTYCRSKTFIATSGINPLLAAASALFSLNTKLMNSIQYDKVAYLREDLVHEIKAFECALNTQGYHSEVILVARFALCVTLDETIQNTLWGSQIPWHENNLLYTFQGENVGGDSFFIILERLCKNAAQYIELLELFYICLSLGFKGKYQRIEYPESELECVIDNLFQLIRKERGDFSPLLCSPTHFTPQKTRSRKKAMPLWAIGSMSLFLLVTLYLSFNYLVQVSTTPLYHKLENLTTVMELNQNVQHQT